MVTSHAHHLSSRLRSWLDAPLSAWSCLLGWGAATALFVGIVALFGGPSIIDTRESLYGTWAVAHGQMACVYPSVTLPGFPPLAPLYLLLSGAVAAVAGIGHPLAFPSAAALGPHCDKAFVAMNLWSVQSGAERPTEWIGCLGWLALMGGVVAWLRASGRGRCGWEPATLVVLACLPPVWMCVQSYFHPQDLLAMGLCLGAVACALRDRWIAAGILVALAVLSQQFALLVAAPLLVLAPGRRRLPYAAAAVVTGALVDLPLLALSGSHALRAITIGTGNTPSVGGTVLWELHLSGAPAVLVTRVAPIAVSLALAWWVARRLGPAALRPATLLSVVAVSLGLRLVFEQNLFAYYFMALAVSLVLLDAVRGQLRNTLLAWLAAVALVFCFRQGDAFEQGVRWGGAVQDFVPFVVLVPVLLVMLRRVLRGDLDRSILPWLGVAACAIITWPGHVSPLDLRHVGWLWQMVVVIPGVLLAARPLLDDVRRGKSEVPTTCSQAAHRTNPLDLREPTCFEDPCHVDGRRKVPGHMELHEALYTTRAMRRVTKDPIPHDVQARILDAAIHAPSGGNQQNWRFLLLDDPAQKAALAPLYQHAMGELWKSVYKPQLDAAHANPDAPESVEILRIQRSAQWLADHFEDVPLYLFPFSPARPDRRLDLPRRVERHAGRPGRGRRQLPDRPAAVLPPGRDLRDPRDTHRRGLEPLGHRQLRLPHRHLGRRRPASRCTTSRTATPGAPPSASRCPQPLWPG